MRFTLAILLMLTAFAGAEEAPTSLAMQVGAGVDYMARKAVNPDNYDWSPSLGLDVGIDVRGAWGLFVEWRYQENSSREGSFQIRTEENQFLVWGRSYFMTRSQWALWGQVGAGERFRAVKTQVDQSRLEQHSDGEFVSGVAVGAGWEWWPQWRFDLLGKALRPELSTAWELGTTLSLNRRF